MTEVRPPDALWEAGVRGWGVGVGWPALLGDRALSCALLHIAKCRGSSETWRRTRDAQQTWPWQQISIATYVYCLLEEIRKQPGAPKTVG